MNEAVSRLADILLFLEQDKENNDESHKAADNVVKRFKEYLCEESVALGAIANETEWNRLKSFSEAVGRLSAESFFRVRQARENMKGSILRGEIPGTEVLAGVKNENGEYEVLSNEDAAEAVGDALVNATDYNCLRTTALNNFFNKEIIKANSWREDFIIDKKEATVAKKGRVQTKMKIF